MATVSVAWLLCTLIGVTIALQEGPVSPRSHFIHGALDLTSHRPIEAKSRKVLLNDSSLGVYTIGFPERDEQMRNFLKSIGLLSEAKILHGISPQDLSLSTMVGFMYHSMASSPYVHSFNFSSRFHQTIGQQEQIIQYLMK